jgi:hypothetical protein
MPITSPWKYLHPNILSISKIVLIKFSGSHLVIIGTVKFGMLTQGDSECQNRALGFCFSELWLAALKSYWFIPEGPSGQRRMMDRGQFPKENFLKPTGLHGLRLRRRKGKSIRGRCH